MGATEATDRPRSQSSDAQPSDAQSGDQSDRTQQPPQAAKGVLSFLRSNCLDCHDGPGGEGSFDVQSLLEQPRIDSNSMHRWVRVHDRVVAGEMPPEDYGAVDAKTKSQFIRQTNDWIDQQQSQQHALTGRVGTRRLTRHQLQWTLGDLLSIDVPLAELMPEEPRTDGFRGIAAAQSMSHYYLEDHLRVVDSALDFAFDRAGKSEDVDVIDLPANEIANKRKGQRNRDPEMRQGSAVVWSGGVSFYGRISHSRIDRAGWYEITLNASAVKPPKDRNVWCSVRSGKCVSREPLMHWIDAIEVTEEPATFRFLTWLNPGDMLEIRPADTTLKKARFRGGQIGFGEGEPQDVPGIAMHHLTLKQVFPGGDQEAVRKSLFGDLNVRFDESEKRLTLSDPVDASALKSQVKQFATQAFRQPVERAVLQPFFHRVDRGVDDDEHPIELLRQVYRAILCSPRFVYFYEQPGRLDDFAIATRLSYLLTGKAPDEALYRDAAAGRLTADRKVIAGHVRRLLDSEHLDHFVRDFTDQWLDLADIDFTEPDRRMHPQFDLIVQNAMLEETQRFVKTLLVENRPAKELVDADFTWLNSRLADFYEIDCDIAPSQWERVSLAEHPYRGGLLTHGAILKVTANGSNTSPVLRGVWMCDRLLGVPIPDPPSNIPAIEPDVRGATTIREILEKHRSQTECASCHAKIDPPGFALEKFDAAGQWRDHYLKRKGRSFRKGLTIDASYEMADGRSFESFTEFRDLAGEDRQRVAWNFAAKVLTYATGSGITFADRKALDAIVAQAADDDYGLRSIIEAVVISAPFLHK